MKLETIANNLRIQNRYLLQFVQGSFKNYSSKNPDIDKQLHDEIVNAVMSNQYSKYFLLREHKVLRNVFNYSIFIQPQKKLLKPQLQSKGSDYVRIVSTPIETAKRKH